MIDLYYKASIEAEFYAKLPADMLIKNESEVEVLRAHSPKWEWDWNISHKISDDIVDAQTNEILTHATFSPNFHANLRLLDESIDVSSLAEFLVTPQTPNRRFA